MEPRPIQSKHVCRECGAVVWDAEIGTPCPRGCEQVLIDRRVAARYSKDQYLGRFLGSAGDPREYALLDLVGKGAFGAVYRGFGRSLRREVAVKLVHPQKATKTSIARFKREATLVAQLQSPYTVTLHSLDCEPSERFLYMTMELVKGRTVGQALDEEERFAPLRAISIALQILEALAEAHGLDETIVHRDLKPGNIMLVPRQFGGEMVKVLDFGLAKMLDAAYGAQDVATPQPGAIVGTLAYMAPELFAGQASPQSDLYALGTLLYVMLVGKTPFHGNDLVDYFNLHRFASAPPFPIELDIAPELEQVVRQALEKCPTDRHQSAVAMHEALRLARQTATDTIDVSVDDVLTATPVSLQVPDSVGKTALDMPQFETPPQDVVEQTAREMPRVETPLQVAAPVWLPTMGDPESSDSATLPDLSEGKTRAWPWPRMLLGATVVVLIIIAGWRIGFAATQPPNEAPTVQADHLSVL